MEISKMFISCLIWYWNLIAVAADDDQKECSIPPHLLGKWDLKGYKDTWIDIRPRSVITNSNGTRQNLQCVEEDGGLMLLRKNSKLYLEPPKYICWYISDMADLGFTLQRMNTIPNEGNVLTASNSPEAKPPSLDNICNDGSSGAFVVISRKQPEKKCSFGKKMMGNYKIDNSFIDEVIVEKNAMIFRNAKSKKSLSFPCEQKNTRKYLLRYSDSKNDAVICLKIFRLPDGKLMLIFRKDGTLLNGMVKLVRHLQPLYVTRDCINTQEKIRMLLLPLKP